MDDIKAILYIIFGIIYFLFRVFKNKKATHKQPQYNENKADDIGVPHDQSKSAPNKPRNTGGGTSLEDILRELSGGFYEENEKPATQPANDPQYQKAETGEKFNEQNETSAGRSKSPFTKEQSKNKYEAYETADYGYSEKEGKRHKTLDEQIDIENFEIKVNPLLQNIEEGPSSKFSSQYTKILRNPEEAKKAIILSEIINRKYD